MTHGSKLGGGANFYIEMFKSGFFKKNSHKKFCHKVENSVEVFSGSIVSSLFKS